MASNLPLPSRRDCLRRLAQAATAASFASFGSLASATSLAKVRERGTLIVGLYEEMPPFHDAGKGIDVDLARALAEVMGVKATLLPFHADDSMNDDLRHMVWRGHYLGHGPADVLMHVPVERPLMDANPQVAIFAPYHREHVMLARNLERVPTLDAMSQLAGQRVAVPGQTIAGWLLLGADGGAYRDQLSTQWKDGTACARALRRGEVTVAAGLASELESELRGDARFSIGPMPAPRAPREGWAHGLAVKSDATDLARTLQEAMNQLRQGGRLDAIFAAHNVAWRAP